MRLFLLPISTRRTLLYCQRLAIATPERQSWMDRVQTRAAKVWADWEKKEKGWQKSVVSYGNYAFRRIPYEEWGLKSVPPLSQRRREEQLKEAAEKVEVVYPQTLISRERVPGVLETLATEREGLHRRKLIWCFVGMPLTAPIAIIPIVPNLPFFYLVYRAWSHWRALAGGKHIKFLLQRNLLSYSPSKILDEVYATQKGPLPSSPEPTTSPETVPLPNPRLATPDGQGEQNADGETMLLSQASGKNMTRILDLPQLEVELERAIWQVETAMRKQSEEKAATDGNRAGSSTTEARSKKEAGLREEAAEGRGKKPNQ